MQKMDIAEIKKQRHDIARLLHSHRLAEALAALHQLVETVAKGELIDEWNRIATTYKYMLKYMADGLPDPQRGKVLDDIVGSALDIADKCEVEAAAPTSYDLFFLRHNSGAGVSLNCELADYTDACSRLAAATGGNTASLLDDREKIEVKIFNKVWSSYPLTAVEAGLLRRTLASGDVPPHFKSMIVAALLLGLTVYYDEQKLLLLACTYTTATLPEVQLRALVGTALAMHIHSQRIACSAAVHEAAEAMLSGSPHLAADMQCMMMRLARARNAENVSNKLNDTIIPDIMKANPDLAKKLRNRSTPIDFDEIEGNPEWQNWLEESGIRKKIDEFNELQMEGNDVFIGTFAKLKSYPFFQTLANWFTPFHPDHSALTGLNSGGSQILKMLEAAPLLCNSDKFSFALTLLNMPGQREAIASQLGGQMSAFNHASGAESRDAIINRYIQDLYRFFKLFSRRREFRPLFDADINLTRIPYLGQAANTSENLSLVAEYYLKAGFHADAVTYFNALLMSKDSIDPRIFQKLGFAYQNLGDTAKALDCYKKYEIANGGDAWNLRRIAMAYRNLRQWDEALKYYQKADELHPGLAANALSMGHCLLEKGNAAEALNYYFKADLIDEASHKAWRPIAWCSLLTGNYEQSDKYYRKIAESDTPTAQDMLNHGHMLLCAGRVKEAVETYRRAARADRKAFAASIESDAHYLAERGVSEADLHLAADAATAGVDWRGNDSTHCKSTLTR